MYELRYLCKHLVTIDLKNKYRRSKLGMLWTFFYPLCLSCIMGVVFSVALKVDILTYMPYVLSGIIFWDVVTYSFSGGGYSIIYMESFVRQCNHPKTLYTLKSSIVTMINFSISFLSLLIWTVIGNYKVVPFALLFFPLIFIIYLLFSWGATTIAGYTCVKYRDYPMMIPLILQIVWYISPVFLKEEFFMTNEYIYLWFRINPITHMLNLIRKPFLYGVSPSGNDFIVSMIFVLLIDLWAYFVNKKNERNIIFYL